MITLLRQAAVLVAGLSFFTTGAVENASPRWFDQGRLTPQAQQLLSILGAAPDYGLSAQDYRLDFTPVELQALTAGTAAPPLRERFDAALSQGVRHFLMHVRYGRVDPRTVHFALPARTLPADVEPMLDRLARSNEVAAAVSSWEPKPPPYRALKQALRKYRELAMHPELNALPGIDARSLQVGDEYPGAPQLRTLLTALGDLPAVDAAAHASQTTIDVLLAVALTRFQERHGLAADGVLGKRTFTALTVPLRQRVLQLELTLERWRWIAAIERPDIVVNVPQFKLYALPREDHRHGPILEMRVIVGQSRVRLQQRTRTTTAVTYAAPLSRSREGANDTSGCLPYSCSTQLPPRRHPMKRVAILTSGGDAPGMNAAVRAMVCAGVQCGFEVLGVRHGYRGLMSSEFVRLERLAVDATMQLAGTMLGTSRCDAFKTDQGQEQAERALRAHAVGALIVIGGNGSQSGAHALAQRGVNVIGVASTIDNDLEGTEIAIGTTSAQQVAVEAIDRLRITAASHERAFLVEVMGRHSGYLATVAAIAGGADALVTPECEPTPETLAAQLWTLRESGQRHAIVVIGEGATRGAHALAEHFAAHATALPFELRVARLGHIQRAGGPNVYDRTLATRFGIAAIERVAAENYGVLIGLRDGAIKTTPLSEVAGRTRAADPQLLATANTLIRRTPARTAKGEPCT